VTPIPITAFDLAQRYIGIRELAGKEDHPLILWWLSLCNLPPHQHDETPWCSAFLNGIAWELRLPRSKSAAARSWLMVGLPIPLEQFTPGFDVAILARGEDPQPDATVLDAPGHVGLLASRDSATITLLAGNQGNAVSLTRVPLSRVLGIRRLA
jgi:uncharacterized protein (TIGR02594 family)